jgi:hypothetical protein
MIRPIEVLGPSGGGFVVSSDEDGTMELTKLQDDDDPCRPTSALA